VRAAGSRRSLGSHARAAVGDFVETERVASLPKIIIRETRCTSAGHLRSAIRREAAYPALGPAAGHGLTDLVSFEAMCTSIWGGKKMHGRLHRQPGEAFLARRRTGLLEGAVRIGQVDGA